MKIDTTIPKQYNSPVFLLLAIALTMVVAAATTYYVGQLFEDTTNTSQMK